MGELTPEELRTNTETQKHVDIVRLLLSDFSIRLLDRGEKHDRSKFSESELPVFTKYTQRLKETTYGSGEYKQFLAEMKPALDHHYANNRHHPEFHLQSEKWLPVLGFEGHYEISNQGRVRSLDREVGRSGGRGSTPTGQLLQQEITPKGYCRVQLQAGAKRSHAMVHRLVASAFIPNEKSKPEVNHKDGRKRNNWVSNLEWVTTSENLTHSYEESLRKPSLKYVVTCEDLDLTELGCEKMAAALRSRGYKKANSAGIWRCINHGGKHLDLTFTGSRIETWMVTPIPRMTLVDLVEMLFDWWASTKRHADGDIMRSIELNEKRFNIPPELSDIFRNTIRALESGQL